MEYSMTKVVRARLLSESTVPKQQSVPKSCPLDHQTNQICYLNEDKEDCCTLAFSRTHESPTKIKSSKFLGQCNRIRAKLKLVFCPKRLALVDDKCINS
ncbi:hypothetical protein ACTXT7_016997 [Hymenolepis weldensis]